VTPFFLPTANLNVGRQSVREVWLIRSAIRPSDFASNFASNRAHSCPFLPTSATWKALKPLSFGQLVAISRLKVPIPFSCHHPFVHLRLRMPSLGLASDCGWITLVLFRTRRRMSAQGCKKCEASRSKKH